jgi:hypothetical protein
MSGLFRSGSYIMSIQPPWALAAIAAVTLATACNGSTSSHSYVPLTSPAERNPLIRWGANPLPRCLTKYYSAPGKFTILTAVGAFSGSSFSSSGVSLWANIYVPKGKNQIPIIHLPNIKTEYTVYYGTYSLRDGLIGCFYLAKVSYQGISFDGLSAAVPNVNHFGKARWLAEGPLVIAIKGISARAGSGTLTLKNASGGIIGTGTIKIKGSKIVK